jgi:hypothetical protein
VIVFASADQASLLLRELGQFAESHNFRVVRGDLPKQGRLVANTSIQFGDDTFFHIDNFIAENKYYLDAYSHDEPGVWVAPWRELVTRISETLGPDHVQVVKHPPD